MQFFICLFRLVYLKSVNGKWSQPTLDSNWVSESVPVVCSLEENSANNTEERGMGQRVSGLIEFGTKIYWLQCSWDLSLYKVEDFTGQYEKSYLLSSVIEKGYF